MTDLTDAGALFHAGRLREAVAAANAAVRKAPTDVVARVLLAELLLFQGNLERADLILDAAAGVAPDSTLVIAEFRQLLRAEQARRQLGRDGRLPEFLHPPTPALSAILAAYVALRVADPQTAANNLLIAEAERIVVRGKRDGGALFDDLRDADDLCSGFFEVLTTTGKYYWIPTERVESVLFHPPLRPRDLFWRRATMTVRDGPDGDVYIPALYVSNVPDLSEALLLGRETDWLESDGITRGVGQRMFLIGEDAFGIMELGALLLGAATA
jgi:type VI secretion system protein ImpE